MLRFIHKYIYGIRVFLGRKGDYFVHNSNWLVFVTDIESVSCEAGTVLAYMLKLTLQGIALEL